MRRTPWNEGWEFRPKQNRHAEMTGQGAPWEPVTLPHDAVIGTERSPEAGPATGYFPGGVWEYRRTLEGPADGVVGLEFEGVYRDAIVTVNGTRAAHRPYGYTRFFVPIDHLLRPAENEVKVEAMAHQDSRWYSGGGIHRDVWLLEAGPVHLVPDGVSVLTPEVDDGGASLAVAVELRNRGPVTVEPVLRIEVLDPDGTVVSTDESPVTAFPGDELTIRRRLFVPDPQRWGPDHPVLHTCRVALGDLDEETTTFGIRTLSVDPQRGLRINGEPVKLRGACVHHDNGPIGAAAIARAEERRVELLQAAGFNALRSAHNPMSRAMLDACDRLGVLVMDETFDMWDDPKTEDDYARRYDGWWEADVEAMVRKDVNHPSVIMYCIGNEIPDGSTPAGLHRARAQAEKIRSLDPSRYVTQAISGVMAAGPRLAEAFREHLADVDEDAGGNTVMNNLAELMNEVQQGPVITELLDEASSHLDVTGYNYMHTRFAADGERYPNRVIVASETHPSDVDVGWGRVVEHPYVIGDFCWTGWDYLGEAGIGRAAYAETDGEWEMQGFHGEFPWIEAWCGDLDITGHRRPQSYYREIVYGLRTDPYVAVVRPEHHGKVERLGPWAWSDAVSRWSWPGHEGAPVAVEVYADADEVELLVGGESLGRQPVERFRASFDTTYQPGEVVAVAWRGDEEVGRTTLSTGSGDSVELRADRTELAADPSDLAFVEILSAGGDREVAVEVDGPGVLQGLASARPSTEEPYTGSTVTTFDGRALAVVRPTGAGTVTVRCAGQELELTVG